MYALKLLFKTVLRKIIMRVGNYKSTYEVLGLVGTVNTLYIFQNNENSKWHKFYLTELGW